MLVAVACRVGAAGSRLHIDDAYSWWVASAPGGHAFLTRLAATENTPPLFYALLSVMPSFSPTWLRIPALIPGILLSPVVYLLTRGRLRAEVGLLAALAVAVAPFLVTYADLARGFMLADLALLVCLWSLLVLSDRAHAGRHAAAWWALFVFAGVVALWTEYDSAIVLIAIAVVAWAYRLVRRRDVLLFTGLVFVTMAPWIPQIVRAQNQVGHTKFSPLGASPSVSALRDLLVTLTFGENGGTSNTDIRWGLAAVIAAALSLAAARLAHGWKEREPYERRTLLLLGGTAGLAVIGYALAAVVGIHVFSQRYLTILIPLVAPVVLAALLDLRLRWIAAAATVVLLALGIGNAVRRAGGEYEPSFAPVSAVALADRPRTVLTNTPVAQYYLPSLHVIFDRSYNIGPGLGATCTDPCLTIDDARVHGGTPRTPVGPAQTIGPYVLSLRK